MSQDSVIHVHTNALDPNLLNLNEEEAEFFKSQTGIQNNEELRNHIIEVQKKAYETHKYPCIQNFSFTRQARPSAIILDIACCFGNDIRKAVADGWPVENALASDISKEFWDQGHELFKSTPETFSVGFVDGDALSSSLIEPREPFYSPPLSPRPTDLRTLVSLTPLQGHISVIHASSFFHLFDEEKQLALAKQLASLLSSEPGSIIFGSHGGLAAGGIDQSKIYAGDRQMFCHSPETWTDLWDGTVFRRGIVKVEVRLVEHSFRSAGPLGTHINLIVWSVTRL
ncbi:hypothetical protein AGABI2DRAFT_183081 [Agaricus bisporus var. bisporus H97]|uniref:hypothetical protein n=1 Tax=Agaricus bisporus var. bisporus (strain H97 / ATCC MYA-4626 / FGSC 10389) TaxID=936046 RepID=UPI00029F55B3|nr:hypothetical protein AGABI2DRAFT_183081 [Agaricus bisporus var. bisporus H97]EKV49927.1 hypothetical protein AGABI2DRAFT_183081 [Agaricus bisporus var. bisporus H97]